MTLEKYIYQKFIFAYNSIPQNELEDIYAFTLLINHDSNSNYPMIIIGYNTNKHTEAMRRYTSSIIESRWDYNWWLQNSIRKIGGKNDKIGKKKINTFIETNNILVKKEGGNIDALVSILINSVKSIHKTGITQLPIIINKPEYSDGLLEQNIQANGKERIIEYKDYITEKFLIFYDEMDLSEYIYNKFLFSFNSIPEEKLKDIYLLSFFYYNDDDDPRTPYLAIWHNTESNYNLQKDKASSPWEARWEYPFWIDDSYREIGSIQDSVGREKIRKLILDEGLNYTDEEWDKEFQQGVLVSEQNIIYDEKKYSSCCIKGYKIQQIFISILIDVVQKIHKNGITKIPIIIHNTDYNEKIIEYAIKANGEERVKGFVDYCNKIYTST